MVTYTWFQQEKRRRYTWKNPGDRQRFQIDYILVKQRYRNSVKSSWSYPGADVNSDHNLVAMKVNVKLKKIERRTRQKKWDMDQLRTKEIQFRTGIEESIQEGSGMTVERRWNRLKDTVMEKATEHIGYKKGKDGEKTMDNIRHA